MMPKEAFSMLLMRFTRGFRAMAGASAMGGWQHREASLPGLGHDGRVFRGRRRFIELTPTAGPSLRITASMLICEARRCYYAAGSRRWRHTPHNIAFRRRSRMARGTDICIMPRRIYF